MRLRALILCVEHPPCACIFCKWCRLRPYPTLPCTGHAGKLSVAAGVISEEDRNPLALDAPPKAQHWPRSPVAMC